MNVSNNAAKTLLLTKHGSHLYGLNHAQSDDDYYLIWDVPYKYRSRKLSTHKIMEKEDITSFFLDKYEEQIY